MVPKSIERIAEELGVSFHALQPYILMREEISFKAAGEWLARNSPYNVGSIVVLFSDIEAFKHGEMPKV